MLVVGRDEPPGRPRITADAEYSQTARPAVTPYLGDRVMMRRWLRRRVFLGGSTGLLLVGLFPVFSDWQKCRRVGADLL